MNMRMSICTYVILKLYRSWQGIVYLQVSIWRAVQPEGIVGET
jgi:hypothetical protein